MADLVAASVCYLLLTGGPPAIPWLVIPIVINPVKRESSRTLAHIGQEVFETRLPSGADGNPSSAIVFIALMRNVVTSGLHACPDVVFGSAGTAVAREVSNRASNGMASTTGRLSGLQMCVADRFCLSAITLN